MNWRRRVRRRATSAGTGDNSGATNDVDCTGGATINNYTLANPGVALTAAQIADLLDTLSNVTDATHGALTVGAGAATTTVFTEGTAVAGDITFTDGTTSFDNSTVGTTAFDNIVDGSNPLTWTFTNGGVVVAGTYDVTLYFTPENSDTQDTFKISATWA